MRVAEGLDWLYVYWVRGVVSKRAKFQNAVKDPPCAGWQQALVLTGEKHSTIFCPFSLTAYSVPNDCGELAGSREPEPFRTDFMVGLITRNWEQFQGFGFSRDYDTAALVLRRLDAPVPAQVMKGGGEDTRTRGGKSVGDRLTKPVKLASKRGRFLVWFLADDGGPKSVRECMAEFGVTRSNALSYLFMLNKDHGLGYGLVGDTAEVFLPEGCESPFDVVIAESPAEKVVSDDDSWLQ